MGRGGRPRASRCRLGSPRGFKESVDFQFVESSLLVLLLKRGWHLPSFSPFVAWTRRLSPNELSHREGAGDHDTDQLEPGRGAGRKDGAGWDKEEENDDTLGFIPGANPRRTLTRRSTL